MFTIGLIFVVSGLVQELDPQCQQKSDIRILPRNVYDQLIKDATL